MIDIHRHCERAKQRKQFRKKETWIAALFSFARNDVIALLLIMFLPFAAHAEPFTYQPDFCEFTITFPHEPEVEHKCEDRERTRCYDEVTYTRVPVSEGSVNFRIICNKIGQDVIDAYSGEVMQKTLAAMTKDKIVDTYDTNFREADGYKQASLVGEGVMGRISTLYIGQLWIGKKSAFSVEGQMLGAQSDVVDQLFSDILRTIRYKPQIEEAEEDDKS